jgi:hypothetical protein
MTPCPGALRAVRLHRVCRTRLGSRWLTEHLFGYAPCVADLPIPELFENRRRSIAMLPVGAPALNRDEALELLEQFKTALLELRRLRALVGGG